ncbi:MAG: helix-turn-helix transcriptional regulator [Actinomycetota bacterium]|nr:helix-turn-helix transcriptional regulator [Actinomycetota bacterium]
MTTSSHRQPRSGCAINAAIEALDDPWSMLVLRDVIFGNRRHFRELIQGSAERIASNIPSSRLERLVAAGLLTREEAARGQRAAYSLTEAGIQRLPVTVAIGTWGLAPRDGTPRWSSDSWTSCARPTSASDSPCVGHEVEVR